MEVIEIEFLINLSVGLTMELKYIEHMLAQWFDQNNKNHCWPQYEQDWFCQTICCRSESYFINIYYSHFGF